MHTRYPLLDTEEGKKRQTHETCTIHVPCSSSTGRAAGMSRPKRVMHHQTMFAESRYLCQGISGSSSSSRGSTTNSSGGSMEPGLVPVAAPLSHRAVELHVQVVTVRAVDLEDEQAASARRTRYGKTHSPRDTNDGGIPVEVSDAGKMQ